MLHAWTRSDRLAITASVRDAVQQAGGWIIDARQSSNLSICLLFEAEVQHLAGLDALLMSLPLHFYGDCAKELGELASRACDGAVGGEVMCTLQITFLHNDPDLPIPTPAVPG